MQWGWRPPTTELVNGEQNQSDDKEVVRALGEENTGPMNLHVGSPWCRQDQEHQRPFVTETQGSWWKSGWEAVRAVNIVTPSGISILIFRALWNPIFKWGGTASYVSREGYNVGGLERQR